jgi:hypothetical protein
LHQTNQKSDYYREVIKRGLAAFNIENPDTYYDKNLFTLEIKKNKEKGTRNRVKKFCFVKRFCDFSKKNLFLSSDFFMKRLRDFQIKSAKSSKRKKKENCVIVWKY